MSLGEKWTIRNMREEDPSYSRGDLVYQDDKMKVAFSLDRARLDVDRIIESHGLVTWVTGLDTLRYIDSEGPVPEDIGFRIADRIAAYCWEKGWLFYSRDSAGWRDDHAGKRWPGFASLFPTMRHALNWSFTDTRWGQNHHDPYVEYRDEHGAIRLDREVGYGPTYSEDGTVENRITNVLYFPSDYRTALLEDDGSVDDGWLEQAKNRIGEAYSYDFKAVTFVRIGNLEPW